MAEYSDAVRRAMEQPGELAHINGEWIPTGAEDDLITPTIYGLSELPDDTRLRVFNEDVPSYLRPPNRIFTADPGELPGIVEEFAAAAGEQWGLSEEVQERWLANAGLNAIHEEQHGETPRLLGDEVLYSVAISADWKHSVASWHMEMHAIGEYTKLELASSVAHPEWLSSGDRSMIDKMGYSGVEDIAQRAMDQGLPLPLSYRPSTAE